MPQIAINLAVFTGSKVPFGRVTGELDMVTVPREGERLSFQFPLNGITPKQIEGFHFRRTVRSVTHLLGSGDRDVLLELEDLELTSIDDAAWVMAYLDNGFSLVPQIFES